MSYIEVAKKDEIRKGTIKSVSIEGKEIIIVNYEGDYYALNQKCTHRGGDLSKGKLEGKIVNCPLHGSKFDITTGKNISGPKMGFIKLKTGDLRVYDVRIENDSIKINV